MCPGLHVKLTQFSACLATGPENWYRYSLNVPWKYKKLEVLIFLYVRHYLDISSPVRQEVIGFQSFIIYL